MKHPADIPIQFLKGVGPARAKLFENLGVQTVEDLLYLFPRRYEDRTKLTPINVVKPGEEQTIAGTVLAKGGHRRFFNKKHVFEMDIRDESGRIHCVWFNQPYLDNYFHVGDRVVLFGRANVFKERIQFVSPEYEILSKEDASLGMGRIVPIYPLTKGLGQRYLRKLVFHALQEYAGVLMDIIPVEILKRQKLKLIDKSILQLHFPDNASAQEEASRRISFEEFFFFQICVILRRMNMVVQKGFSHKIPLTMPSEFLKLFPFQLTTSQKNVLEQIRLDMASSHPMLRLLQGDVGCGKTVVALFGCAVAFINGRQSAIMAPTEILAEQHFKTLIQYLSRSPWGSMKVALLNSTLKKKDRELLYQEIGDGKIDVVVGTHALIEEGVVFKDLSYVVIDEQHKFGVKQRALLSLKGKNPDVLVMTATPIPRTLCLTLYGDLDVSIIDEKPKGRGEIKTYHFVGQEAEGVYKKVAQWVIQKKTQAYVVYPLVEESEKVDLKAAVDMFTHFKEHDFKDLRVGLIHGRLPREEARATMECFKKHELDILVTTTVLEVGIDVPNANVMVIEHAERFGLSQLHQLRGRIGRSEKNAVCILLGDPQTEEGQERLKALVKTSNGFKIAEKDLEIRGPGQYFGRHQHGLNELKIVNPLTQISVLEAARKEAIDLLKDDPLLKAHIMIKSSILKRYPEYLERTLAG